MHEGKAGKVRTSCRPGLRGFRPPQPRIAAFGVPVPPAPSSSIREEDLKSRDELEREIEVPGERIATLSAAVPRVGSSLDPTTVPREAADSARALRPHRHHRRDRRGARVRHLGPHLRGAPRARRAARRPPAVRLSPRPAGPARARRPARLAPGARPLRRVRARDDPEGAPMRHRHAGKEDAPEFSAVDKETLERFASQAAAAIPRRWASSCSTPAPGGRCPSTGRRTASSDPFVRRAAASGRCWRSRPVGPATGGENAPRRARADG